MPRKFSYVSLVLVAMGVVLMYMGNGIAQENTTVTPAGTVMQVVRVPQVLSDEDIKLYKDMFRQQRLLQRSAVAAKVPQLHDRLLYGHLVAERLLHPATKSSFSELQHWLSKYADHHQAETIYALAKRRAPRHAVIPLPESKKMVMNYVDSGEQKVGEAPLSPEEEAANKARSKLIASLSRLRKAKKYKQAMQQLLMPSTRELLGDDTWASASNLLAENLMKDGHFTDALLVATRAAKVPSRYQPELLWTAGFSAYQNNDKKRAVKVFEQLVESVPHTSKHYGRAAFWAGRTFMQLKNPEKAAAFYVKAADSTTTFYGQLAQELTQIKPLIQWQSPYLHPDELELLLLDDGVRRAVALSQIGEYDMAQQELKYAYERLPSSMDESLLAMSIQLNMPHMANMLAYNVMQQTGVAYYTGMYPSVSMWMPRSAATANKALVYGIIRQESAFNPAAISRVGARGLMQVMPTTAAYIRKQQGKGRISKALMTDPQVNVDMGVFYIDYLMAKLEGNLLLTIAAYNAGPTNARKWYDAERAYKADPLLFIESIPFKETRHYVKKVFANMWIYQKRFNQPQPTLAALAQNSWPVIVLAQR